jgi:hypothetical protein
MKICVLMWYDSTISSYGDINYKINRAYCDKNNIDLIRCQERRHGNRHPAWERIPLILKYIHNYDYVMWIDADAFFYNDGKSIIDLINNNATYNFIFSKDISVAINTGCFIVKNTQYSIDFLVKWGYDKILYENNKYPQWWDNGVILDMYEANVLDIKNNSIVFDYGILQHFYQNDKLDNKPYIFHLAGRSNDIRYRASKEYFDRIK